MIDIRDRVDLKHVNLEKSLFINEGDTNTQSMSKDEIKALNEITMEWKNIYADSALITKNNDTFLARMGFIMKLFDEHFMQKYIIESESTSQSDFIRIFNR